MMNDEPEQNFTVDAAPEIPPPDETFRAAGGMDANVTGLRVLRAVGVTTEGTPIYETITEWGTAKEPSTKQETGK